MITYGFCIGSDRYTARSADERSWAIVDVVGEPVLGLKGLAPGNAVATIALLREAVSAVRPFQFDVGQPDTLNLDLRENETARMQRVHVVNVRGERERFFVALSDSGEVPWSGWETELADLIKTRVGAR